MGNQATGGVIKQPEFRRVVIATLMGASYDTPGPLPVLPLISIIVSYAYDRKCMCVVHSLCHPRSACPHVLWFVPGLDCIVTTFAGTGQAIISNQNDGTHRLSTSVILPYNVLLWAGGGSGGGGGGGGDDVTTDPSVASTNVVFMDSLGIRNIDLASDTVNTLYYWPQHTTHTFAPQSNIQQFKPIQSRIGSGAIRSFCLVPTPATNNNSVGGRDVLITQLEREHTIHRIRFLHNPLAPGYATMTTATTETGPAVPTSLALPFVMVSGAVLASSYGGFADGDSTASAFRNPTSIVCSSDG